MVMSWPTLPTTKDIWEVVNKTYSKVDFASRGPSSVIIDYNSFKGLPTGLDLY